MTIDLGGYTLDRKLKWRGEDGGQVITVREGAKLNLSHGTLKGGWGGASGGINNEGGIVTLTNSPSPAVRATTVAAVSVTAVRSS